MEHLEEVTDIIRDVLEAEDVELVADTALDDIPEWDSIAKMQVSVQLEKRHQIIFPPQEIAKSQTVGDVVRLTEKYAQEKGEVK